MSKDILVNAETLAAALDRTIIFLPDPYDPQLHAAAILAAIPPDPRLDALLAAADLAANAGPGLRMESRERLRDALAAFDTACISDPSHQLHSHDNDE